ncbi:MAG TPA: hypothetical protein VM597_04035 [Gemmataceae bacterium]|jgi:hypothetical protein|nr:hypothetical protein [Gemmataceae bacterium]
MSRPFAVAALVLTLAAPAWAEEKNQIPDDLRAVLEKADKFELLSLSPERLKEKPKDAFHGWKVLGQTTVTAADRDRLVPAFAKGVADNSGVVAACFNPRHGIRATRGGKTAEFVICFECFQVHAYRGDKKEDDSFLITASPQPTFDAVLKAAKVPLAGEEKK